MKVMLLSAGLGERMRPLTDQVPKPLLPVNGRPMMAYQLEALARAGFHEIVINHARFGMQIERSFGDGAALGLQIRYSAEGEVPLDTGGGIRRALPLLGEPRFAVINADIWTDFDYARLRTAPPGEAHLVLVDNPVHNPEGDFALDLDRVSERGPVRLTYSGIGVYAPSLFRGTSAPRFALTTVLRPAVRAGRVSGEHFRGDWLDLGTPERLAELNRKLQS